MKLEVVVIPDMESTVRIHPPPGNYKFLKKMLDNESVLIYAVI